MTFVARLREIQDKLNQELGESFNPETALAVTGGDINQCYCVTLSKKQFFLKTNTANQYALFKAEHNALNTIQQSSTLHCPKPILYGRTENSSFLLMEYVNLQWNYQKESLLGQQLAQMHRVTDTEYGWRENNFIGLTAQTNSRQNKWHTFWLENRLKPQRRLAEANQCSNASLRLMLAVEDHALALLHDHQPPPCLLHGDLWQGNACFTEFGDPIVFDPAAYYGDRETDIAMTELFGGFSESFYEGYNLEWELPESYKSRRDLYQLYHIINHFNLFSHPYDKQVANLCTKILRRET